MIAPVLLSLALVTAPVCPTGKAIPVVSWLVPTIDLAVLNGRLITDPLTLSAIVNLTGEPVAWNGYGAPSSFGAFYYPHHGEWIGDAVLISGDARYELWFWHSDVALTDRVLAFLFRDMTYSGAAHYGQHDFCMASVALTDVQDIEAVQ
jgi:hypothetical protein